MTLATRVKSRLTFKAGKLNTYRFCDNVWTFMLNDVEFREVQEITKVDKVKIVACDGKSKFFVKCFDCVQEYNHFVLVDVGDEGSSKK